MTVERRRVVILTAIAALAVTGYPAASQQPAAKPPRTQLVLLGTGTPRPDPKRSGPATAIVVNDVPYLVDVGLGVVRRAQEAFDKGIKGLAITNLLTAFVTHLHSDHTVGYPDLILTTWVQGRRSALHVYGPAGLEAMTGHVLAAWQADIDIRTKGLERRDRAGVAVEAHDVKPGLVYQDDNVKVTAFPVLHGEWPEAFGYRFDTPDRTIVISGDASPSPALVDNCRRCDVLMHEVFSEEFRPADMPNWLEYRARYHTTTSQLAEIANKTQPGLLILYHRGVGLPGREISDQQYIAEIQRTYRGTVVVGNDLDVY